MTIANIVINGHTYTDEMWRSDWEGVISAIANDIASVVAAKDLVGMLVKTISGDTTLSGDESANLGFVFDGTLSATAAITFAAGFAGPAVIANATSGAQSITCGLATGTTVTIPAGGAAIVFCNTTNFSLPSAVIATSSGASVPGTMSVAGAGTITGNANLGGTVSVAGAATITGAASFGATASVAGAATIGGALSVTGALSGGSTAHFTGAATIGGATSISGALVVSGDNIQHVSAAADGLLVADGASGGFSAWTVYKASGSNRWFVGRDNAPETGDDAGSDLVFLPWADDGTTQKPVPLTMRRDGTIIVVLPTSASGLPSGALWSNGGVVSVA